MTIVLLPNDILTIHEGCYGDTSCSGTVVLAVYSSNSSSYDDDSHHYYSQSNDDRSNSSSSNVTFSYSFECSGNKPAVIASINDCNYMIAGNTLESTCEYPPTPQPTSNNPVQIEVVQTITGCAYDDYLLAQTKYDKTFKQAIVESLVDTGVTISIDDILNFQVQDATTRRKLLQTPTLSISYTVQSSSLSASSLSTALTQALSPTTFTNTLQTAAAANGATGLTTATASAPVITNTSPTSAPTVKPTSASESIVSLVKKSKVGAIVGAIVAVLFVGVCCFILYRHYLKKQGKSSVNIESNTTNPLDHRVTMVTTETDSRMSAAKGLV